jgi:molecular chaperone GrpE (heat shock protein)
MDTQRRQIDIEQEQKRIDTDISKSATVTQTREIKETLDFDLDATTLSGKMIDLHTMLENLSEEVDGWRTWHKTDYLEVIETLKSQVLEIQDEWHSVSAIMQNQREKMESMFQSFPGVIETATIRALALRLSHLEELVSQLLQESYIKKSVHGTRKQLVISVVALGVTVVLWGFFIGINMLS